MSFTTRILSLALIIIAANSCSSGDTHAPGQLATAGGPPADDADSNRDPGADPTADVDADEVNDGGFTADDAAPADASVGSASDSPAACVLAGCRLELCVDPDLADADAAPACEATDPDPCLARFGLCERNGHGICAFRPSAALAACRDAGPAALDASHEAAVGTRGSGQRCGPTEGDCVRDLYCAPLAGSCALGGGSRCKTRPTACDRAFSPVCGCDGRTYDNACLAAFAGVGVASSGVCR